MDAIKNLKQVYSNWDKCSRWEKEQQEHDNRVEILHNNINNNSSIFYNKGKTLINAINTIDQIGINKSENALVSINTAIHGGVTIFGLLGALGGYTLSKLSKSNLKTPKMSALIGYTIFTLIGSAIGNFISSHFAKTATRIARYQTRNNELKDVRNFVTYTDEQIKAAKEKLTTLNDVDDITDDMSLKESINTINAYKKSFETVKSLNKDYDLYKKWHYDYRQKENEKLNNFKKMTLTKEEQKQAEQDKNFILDTIRKLEISSNKYEINSDFAIKTGAVGLSLLSVAGGFFASWGFGKLADASKFAKLSKSLNYISKLSIPAGILSLFLLVGPLAKVKKESAKLGRFQEQEKLLSNKNNFNPYTDEEINNIKSENKIKDITNIGILKEDLKFISDLKSDYQEYLKYKQTQRKDDLKLTEILKAIPISGKQLEEAKKLQQQTFKAFEKIDDKSECLVDDTTAAVNVTTSIINGAACCLANIFTLKFFGNTISKFTKNKSMPGFLEGLKLSKNLSLKNMFLIFIAPFLITRGIILLTSLVGTEIKKKACKIGIMSAANDLENPKNFVIKDGNNLLFNEFNKTNYLK